ncbi:RNA cytidine acetyltransferase 1 [Rhizoctonia solani]|uniref:RNA cytidine acetyltransferase n=1 Tax=Rhizoctonia solani TaxID=456999 RepID=A0A8H7H4V3_9AGAM|nr:RNA cytidine acetyltransferase 1 [Rhizoctonia solani]
MRKQLDNRIPILINNNVKRNHRSFIVLVGDKGRDQVVNLHFLLSQARVSARPSVLWCYKKDLGFTSHRKKREAKIKRDVKRGIREANEQDPFEIFVTVTDIRYTQESHKVLGNTYGMCVLQDFEAITPNLLARTIETVEGGGLVVLLLKTMSSLKQLYTMSMDVHARYRTSSHDSVVARFNERFILSLASCDDCLVLDDELNVLPISRGKDIEPIDEAEERGKGKQIEDELTELKESLADTKPIGELVKLAKTTDQAKALLTFVEAIAEKTLSSTVALTAARGRGKSAALGMAIAASLAHGYSNIFVTSPSPENLKTLFDFIFKGMDALGYEEHLDYDIVQSTNPDFNKAIVRVNVFREHRQTIQYIQPQDAHVLGQAELVIIDEAAAIPLPLVRNLLGPYLVFMASTINGYEGTGRSLSLKLIQQLRESTRPVIAKSNDDSLAPASNSKKSAASGSSGIKARTLREIKLETPIRYGSGDKVEKWLHSVLCLDATVVSRGISGSGCPHPSQCELFYVNRDTLFSYNPASEVFLQRMMALFVSSHYKNSPNDLQLMSDAPAHHLFVLLPPLRDDESTLPDPLVVLQVALEGNISKQAILESLSRGLRSGGDLIPWIISQQFQDNNFAELSGARIVRIATRPDYASMGYGSRALKALESFYNGELFNLDEAPEETQEEDYRPTIDPNATLLTDKVAVRSATQMPPLLQRLSQRKPEVLDYVGVSYGLSPQLLRFWKRAGYCPLYLRQTTSDLTGENTCVMVKNLGDVLEGEEHWIGAFAQDFRRRFLTLLSFQFREFGSASALSILEAIANTEQKSEIGLTELNFLLTPFDLKRLEAYSNSLIDYHVVLDLLPTLATLYFGKRLGPDVKLNAIQSSIMLSLGLQRKSELDIPVNQALALFVKAIRKICARLQNLHKESLGADIPSQPSQPPAKADGTDWKPLAQTVEEELQEAGNEVTRELKAKQREMIDALDLSKYAIDHTSADWVQAEAHVAKLADPNRKKDVSTVVSLKSSAQAGAKKRAGDEATDQQQAPKKKNRRSTNKGSKK